MFRVIFIGLPICSLLLAGCSTDSEYGIKPSPVVQELEGGKSQGDKIETEIRQENIRAQEEQQEPIFSINDQGAPE